LETYLRLENITPITARLDELLTAKRDYLKTKIESRQLKHAMMSWFGDCILKMQSGEIQFLGSKYKQEIFWKILHEKERIMTLALKDKEEQTKIRRAGKQSTGKASGGINEEMAGKAARQSALEDPDKIEEDEINEQNILNQLVQTKAQVNVLKREFEVQLIKMAISMISKEHSSLLGCFEMGAAEQEINVLVHP
jgi:hypothetical protein